MTDINLEEEIKENSFRVDENNKKISLVDQNIKMFSEEKGKLIGESLKLQGEYRFLLNAKMKQEAVDNKVEKKEVKSV